MAFSIQELKERKATLQKTLIELEKKYQLVKGSNSVAERAFGTDIISVKVQIKEIDRYLENSAIVPTQSPEVPRREEVPTTPTILVDGLPPRNGIPSSAKIVIKPDGGFYYVDASGNVIPRN